MEELARENPNIISLAQGGLKLDESPPEIKEYLSTIIGITKADYYGASSGLLELREKIVEVLTEKYQTAFEGVMNAKGNVATHTGPKASTWAGHRTDRYVSAQGNILAGPEVVEGMVRAFNETEGHLSYRLMAALEAGQAAGGDTRGMQSAAMLIVKEDGGVWLNNDVVLRLQVDDAENPIVELRRLVEMAGRQRERIQAQRRGSGR